MSDIDISEFANYLNEKASGIDSKLSKVIELCCRKVHDDIQYSMAHTSVDTSKAYVPLENFEEYFK